MLLRVLASLALITMVACKSDFPVNNPVLYVPQADGTCAKYNLVDTQSITYKFDSYVPCTSIEGGFCLQKGQFESILAWARKEIKSCQSTQTSQPERPL